MKNKSYAVIGLGQFGMTVALTLAEANCDVLAIDDKDDNVQDIAEKRVEVIMTGMLEKNPDPDKEADAMVWVRHMNLLKATTKAPRTSLIILKRISIIPNRRKIRTS